MKKFAQLLLFILSPVNLFSINDLNVQFSQISTNDGLSQNTVRTILEDKKGFIWAGTLNGLNRYDGYNLLVYKPQIGNLNSLIDHRIKDVFQDRDGYLWIKTYKNEFSCYDPSTDSFLKYLPDDASYNDPKFFFNNFYETVNGDVWLWGNSSNCLKVSRKDGKFKSVSFSPDNKNLINCLLEDQQKNIWIGTSSGLFKVKDNDTDVFYNQFSFTNAVSAGNVIYFSTEQAKIIIYDIASSSFLQAESPNIKSSFTNVAKLSEQKLLVTTANEGVYTYNIPNMNFDKPAWATDPELSGEILVITDKNSGIWLYNHTGKVWYHNQLKQTVKKMELIPPYIVKVTDDERYLVYIDSEDLIWITTYGNGLFCYNPTTDTLTNFKYNSEKNSPASDYLLSITEDQRGNIWLGSEYAGIIKVVKQRFSMQNFRPERATSIGKNNNVRTVYETGDYFLIGTKNGSLYVFDKELKREHKVFRNINPYTIEKSDNNKIWIGTKGNGLYIIDEKNYTVTSQITDKNSPLSHNTIFDILKDDKGRMWIGSFGGGIILIEDISNKKFNFFFNNEGNKSYIRELFQDSKGTIWASTSDGIIRFSPDELIKDKHAFKHYQMDLTNTKGLNCNDIKVVYEDSEGIIWIGTAGGGLNKFVPATDSEPEHFIAYTTDHGLSGDVISGIQEDKSRYLWISSESGISRFDKKEQSFLTYRFSDQTYGNHFNENANIVTKTGLMMWGSLDGLLIFDPESFTIDTKTPVVTLTNFFIFDQSVKVAEEGSPLKKSISYSERIKLNYKQNTFTIEFATLDLRDPQKNKYIYKLENFDRQWSSVSYNNSAIYKNLPPGDYVFMVKGSNNDGIWNEEVTKLTITIMPPFWKSTIAYVIYFILIMLIIYFTFRLVLRFNDLNNNIKVEKELTNYKLRFFTNISHEFRTPLTLIQGAIENLNQIPNSTPETRKQLNLLNRNSIILRRLIDQLLEFRKIQNKVLTLDLEETDMVVFSKDIYSNFEEIAEQKKINYTFDCSVEHFNMYIDQRKIDKILYNLLSNAFKFTPKGGEIGLKLDFDEAKKTCLISVKDSGIGIQKDKQELLFSRFMQINFSASGTGVGLSLLKEFVDVHKGKVWFEESPTGGSIFKVELSTDPNTYEGNNFINSSYINNKQAFADTILDAPKEEEKEAAENIELSSIEKSTLAKYSMLIIDDNDDIRNFLYDEFSKYFEVEVAEDGEIGLEKAIKLNPDLIICDVMMPKMDGFEVTRRLKAEFQTCHIPIILLTAHSSQEHQIEGIQSGADSYVIKPFSLQYLVTRVFKLIEQREQLKKRFSNESVIDLNLITTVDRDKEFYNLINKIFDENLSNPQFSVDKFAELANLGRTVFYKKVKGITGLSPNEFIKVKRLKYAAELLLKGELTVSEIAYKIGFDDPFYFSKCFKAQYNCSPSKYGNRKQTGTEEACEENEKNYISDNNL